MADIILVYPATGSDMRGVSVELPLAVLSAASIAVLDYEVVVIDQRVGGDWRQRLRDELRKSPLYVGISSMTGPQVKFGLEAASLVKSLDQDIPVVWGGVHASLLPEQTASHPLVDVAVVGEGETALPAIADVLKKRASLESVPNLAFKKDAEVVLTPPFGEFLDLDALPSIPYELVNIEDYVHAKVGVLGGHVSRALPFIASRGCPFSCTFCCNPKISRRRWRSMSAETAYERVLQMVEKYRLDGVLFHDENFLGNIKRAEKFAEMINGQFRWFIQGRMDGLARCDLQLLERSGLRAVQPGLESGSDRILSLIRKGETVEHFVAANRALARTDISAIYNFMMGFPSETQQELLQSVDLALQLLEENKNAQIAGFYVFSPYPGTELFDLALENGFQPPIALDDWASFNRQHLRTPWIQPDIEMLEYLMFTSKLVDGVRLHQVFSRLHVPAFLVSLMGARYRRKWRKRDFARTPDIAAMNLFARRFLHW